MKCPSRRCLGVFLQRPGAEPPCRAFTSCAYRPTRQVGIFKCSSSSAAWQSPPPSGWRISPRHRSPSQGGKNAEHFACVVGGDLPEKPSTTGSHNEILGNGKVEGGRWW